MNDDYMRNCTTCQKGKNKRKESMYDPSPFDIPPICVPAQKQVPSRLFVCNGFELRIGVVKSWECLTCGTETYFDDQMCTVCGSFGPEGDFHDPDLDDPNATINH